MISWKKVPENSVLNEHSSMPKMLVGYVLDGPVIGYVRSGLLIHRHLIKATDLHVL